MAFLLILFLLFTLNGRGWISSRLLLQVVRLRWNAWLLCRFANVLSNPFTLAVPRATTTMDPSYGSISIALDPSYTSNTRIGVDHIELDETLRSIGRDDRYSWWIYQKRFAIEFRNSKFSKR